MGRSATKTYFQLLFLVGRAGHEQGQPSALLALIAGRDGCPLGERIRSVLAVQTGGWVSPLPGVK